MDWNKLLCDEYFDSGNEVGDLADFSGLREAKKRLGEDSVSYTAFDESYQRVISSSAVRSLQDKTQVFALDESDFVRTRLTHSLEVSGVARDIACMVAQSNKVNGVKESLKDKNFKTCLESVLSTAGLLHDIGNPPFGHFGETVIQDWLEANVETLPAGSLNEEEIQDLKYFDGNAQTFRILAKRNIVSDMADVNVAYAVLGALMKYPRSPLFAGEDGLVEYHKAGYFHSERASFERLSKKMGTLKQNADSHACDPVAFRHPLAYLLEAADDIAYRTADFEDGFKKGLITLRDISEFGNLISNVNPRSAGPDAKWKMTVETFGHLNKLLESESDPERVVHYWLRQVRYLLMNSATFVFNANIGDITSGDYSGELLSHSSAFHGPTMELFKAFAEKKLYTSRVVLEKEVQARRVLETLLECLVRGAVAHVNRSQGGKRSIDEKYYELIPEDMRNAVPEMMRQSEADENPVNEHYAHIRMVLDYVSSLTDSAALRLYRLMAC